MRIVMTVCAVVFLSVPALTRERTPDTSPLNITIPAAEIPYNTSNGGRFPGMYQSLTLSNDAAYAGHSAVDYALDPVGGWAQTLGRISFDVVMTWMPGGSGWLHEEWHRAVLGRYGFDSYNDIYKFNIGSDTVAVSHVSDADLAWLKEHHNPDMVRLMEAGNEAEIEQTRIMRRDSFFAGRPLKHDLVWYYLSLVNCSYYIYMCTTDEADTMTDKMSRKEKTVEERDFTGLDFNAWIYDLNRPDEKYSARGTHISGNGIDRYIKKSDLSDSELRYLRRTAAVSLLNFVSPQLLGIDRFRTTDPFTGGGLELNGALFHHLTSFGWDIGCDMFFREGEKNVEVIFHGYSNKSHFFPGIEAGLFRDPVTIAGKTVYASLRALAFVQPRDSRFKTSDMEPGGLLGAGIAYPFSSFGEIFLEGSVKSDGWVTGDVYLDRQAELRTGVTFTI